jgi:hypothetical protein
MKKLLSVWFVVAVAGVASAQVYNLSDNGVSASVVGSTGRHSSLSASWVPHNPATQALWYYRTSTSGAFTVLSDLTLDTANSGVVGGSVLNLNYIGSNFNVLLRYSLVGGATSAQLSEQIRVTNISGSPLTLQLVQYGNYRLANLGGTNDVITRVNSSTMHHSGAAGSGMQMTVGATGVPHYSQLGQAFSTSMVSAGFGNLDTPAGSGIGQTSSPADAAFGFQWNTTLAAGDAYQAGSVKQFQAVPEPGTMAALGLGALALLRRRRK